MSTWPWIRTIMSRRNRPWPHRRLHDVLGFYLITLSGSTGNESLIDDSVSCFAALVTLSEINLFDLTDKIEICHFKIYYFMGYHGIVFHSWGIASIITTFFRLWGPTSTTSVDGIPAETLCRQVSRGIIWNISRAAYNIKWIYLMLRLQLDGMSNVSLGSSGPYLTTPNNYHRKILCICCFTVYTMVWRCRYQ